MVNLKYKKFTIQDDEGYFVSDGIENLIYFPLKSLIYQVSSEAGQIIQKENDPLLRKELIKQVKIDLKKVKKFNFPKVKRTEGSNVLGLALTTTCNLSCTYCHANANASETNAFLREEIIDTAIDLVFNNCKKSKSDFYLVFTGSGEPTVFWNGLQRTLEKAKSLCKSGGINFHSIMSTNGYYGMEKRKYICKNFSRVSLSLDGPQEFHDENRYTQTGIGSFATVFSTAKFFFREKFPFGIRATVSQKGVDNMLNIFEFFQQNFPGVTIAFEPLIPMGRGWDHPELVPKATDFVNGYCEIMRKYGKDRVAYSGISFKKLRNKFCGPVAGPHFNVEMDGLVHGCSRIGSSENFVFGRYNSESRGFDIDNEKNRYMSEICVDNLSECKECFARYNCAGDCHDFRERGYIRCDANRAILWSYLCKEI
ncbi:Anaerobic sulfatase-maturating enzyme [uncultured bacterium]|nr:Anaerobic sulfatase-maturating enzyme [uncultured bacterium]